MITSEKKKAIIGIPLGLILFFTPLVMWRIKQPLPGVVVAVSCLGGLGVYIWGCLALAKAKGHSTAIVLTFVLGVLFPAVVLLALPDKHPRNRMSRRSSPGGRQ